MGPAPSNRVSSHRVGVCWGHRDFAAKTCACVSARVRVESVLLVGQRCTLQVSTRQNANYERLSERRLIWRRCGFGLGETPVPRASHLRSVDCAGGDDSDCAATGVCGAAPRSCAALSAVSTLRAISNCTAQREQDPTSRRRNRPPQQQDIVLGRARWRVQLSEGHLHRRRHDGLGCIHCVSNAPLRACRQRRPRMLHWRRP